jgi:hypothetical protein
MLFRVLVGFMLVALTECTRPNQPQLAGDWKWNGEDETGEVHFASNRSFSMATRGWTTPSVLHESGTWRVDGDKLVLDFDSPYRPKPNEKHIVLAILRTELDRISMRSYDGKKVVTLERPR